MSTFLNRLSQSAATRVEIDSAFAGTPIYHDGLVYGASNKLVCNYAGTPVQYKAGIGFTAAGEMCVVDASAGLPADTIHQSGLPISRAQSRLCVDPTNAVSYWHQGVPFTTVRAVAVDGSGGGGTTFDEARILLDLGESNVFVGQLYYGTSGAGSGFYTVKATFLTAHPALTLQTFAGIAPPSGTAAVPGFAGLTMTGVAPTAILVYDDALIGAPFDAVGAIVSGGYVKFAFSPAVTSIGFNAASTSAVLAIYNSGVFLASQAISPDCATTDFTTFIGYSRA